MPSRRNLLATLGTTAIAGIAGCVGRVSDAIVNKPIVEGPCKDQHLTWPTAGGDPGRTGRTDSDPPQTDADVVDLLVGTSEDGRQRLASSLPAVGEGTAFVPSGAGVVALDLESPDEGLLWERNLNDDIDAVPTLACGVVLVPGLNKLAALDPDTGEQYWQTDGGGSNATTVAATDETVYLAGVNPMAVDIRTGRVKWNVGGGDTLAVDEGVYTTLNSNGTGGIFAHDRNGEALWHLSIGKIVGSASALNGTVWVADHAGTVYAIDAGTGETYWSRRLYGVEKIYSGLAVRGNDVVVPAGVGERSVVLDGATGEPRWAVETGIVTGRPVVGDDWIALGRTNVGVTVYDRATGQERVTWSRDEHDLGTIDGILAIEDGFILREGTVSGLSLIR